jgi:hypothetical protein
VSSFNILTQNIPIINFQASATENKPIWSLEVGIKSSLSNAVGGVSQFMLLIEYSYSDKVKEVNWAGHYHAWEKL